MVLWSFATMRQPCPDLLEAASRPLVRPARLAAFPPNMLPTLLWSLANLIEICGGRAGSGSAAAWREAASSEARPKPFDSSERVSTAVSSSSAAAAAGRPISGGGRGLVLAGMMPLEVLRMAAAESGGPLDASLNRMSAQGVVTVAWAYASSGVRPGRGRGEAGSDDWGSNGAGDGMKSSYLSGPPLSTCSFVSPLVPTASSPYQTPPLPV